MSGIIAAEATKAAGKRSYRKLHEVRVERGDGGVMVHEHHRSNDGGYQEPKAPKVITSHKEFMDHMGGVSKRMGLEAATPAEADGGEEE